MKKSILVSLLCVALCAVGALAFASPPNTVKVNPFGVDYPLIRPQRYPSREADPYERSLGVRRWLNPTGQESHAFDKIMEESYNMFELYGGYGVLGHGDGVFTNAAARWRRRHRGR